MAQGPTGNHQSLETYVTATPPAPIKQSVDPGYTKPAVALGARGSAGSTANNVSTGGLWPDSYQRP